MKPSDSFKDSIQLLFPTVIMRHQFTDNEPLHSELISLLLEKERQEQHRNTGGAQKSNVAGWRSAEDLVEWPHACIQQVTGRVAQAVSAMMESAPIASERKPCRFSISGWANINRQGAYNTMHSHPDNHWGAAYYVKTGTPQPDKPLSGAIEFQDPRPAAGMLMTPGFPFGTKIRIQPTPGELILFPSWLCHCVHPYEGDEERISLAFNIRLITNT